MLIFVDHIIHNNNKVIHILKLIIFVLLDCPVGGQIRVECASPCNTTCANMNTLLACPAVCVINGCQCPSGMVIDEQNNTCVVPAACPTTEGIPLLVSY